MLNVLTHRLNWILLVECEYISSWYKVNGAILAILENKWNKNIWSVWLNKANDASSSIEESLCSRKIVCVWILTAAPCSFPDLLHCKSHLQYSLYKKEGNVLKNSKHLSFSVASQMVCATSQLYANHSRHTILKWRTQSYHVLPRCRLL